VREAVVEVFLTVTLVLVSVLQVMEIEDV
jgi:hypothetical protein